jgi:hypothetical protein
LTTTKVRPCRPSLSNSLRSRTSVSGSGASWSRLLSGATATAWWTLSPTSKLRNTPYFALTDHLHDTTASGYGPGVELPAPTLRRDQPNMRTAGFLSAAGDNTARIMRATGGRAIPDWATEIPGLG